jgi:ubiquinone/menaquinone biosynthesis C-methylase UbiE
VEAKSIVEQPDGLRSRLHGMWGAVAEAWEEHADYVDARGAAITRRMLELAEPQPGERVLDLACGPGGAGLAAAERVAPGGEVVLSDVAPEMTAIAAARADVLGLSNVSTRVLDLERIDQPDAAYDVVLCREGLMFVPDPARAAREIHRVLRAGGRAAIAVWGTRERNPWLGVVFDAASAQVGRPIPPPGIPGPFSLGDSQRLAGVLSDAGLSEVSVSELPVPLRAGSGEEWWNRSSSLAGPLAQILASLPEEAAAALRTRALEAVSRYETPDGLEIPGVSLVAVGRRA